VDFGVTCFLTESTIRPGELGRMVEDRGFDSLLLPEHTHIPVERRSPFPGGELPEYYRRIWDPFVALAEVASATGRLRIGTAVCLVAQHDPIVLAKTVATLDQLSGGRVILGIGAGWNREEAANHGIDPAARFAVMDENVGAMRSIWSNEKAAYEGRHVAFEAIHSWPKPRQDPGPPILVGGNGPRALDRVIDHGDGWLPICLWDLDDVIERIGELRRRAVEAGRKVAVTAYLPPEEPQALHRLRSAGAERAVFMLPSGGRPEVEDALDRLTDLRASYERLG
jgi:probable F420-dependent oxidoreductase